MMEDNSRNSGDNRHSHAPNPNRARFLYLANIVLLCTVTLAALVAGGIFLWRNREIEREKQALQRQLDAVEGESKTLYTSEELDEAREAGRQSGASEERSGILMQIQSDMESGGSTASMLRRLFPDDIVVVNGGKYYFYPVLSSIPGNSFSSGDFELNEAGRLVYKGNGSLNILSGIDVSAADGDIDWTLVAEDDVAFAMLCAGGRTVSEPVKDASGEDADGGSSETSGSSAAEESEEEEDNAPGKIEDDGSLSVNMSGAAEAGLGIGVYWNLGATTEDEAKEEADHLVELLDSYRSRITYPVAVWINVPTDTDRNAAMSRSVLTSCVSDFCGIIADAGYQPEVYGNLAALVMLTDPQKLQSYPRWISNSGASLYFPYEFNLWQYSSTGTVQGISNEVHLDARLSQTE